VVRAFARLSFAARDQSDVLAVFVVPCFFEEESEVAVLEVVGEEDELELSDEVEGDSLVLPFEEDSSEPELAFDAASPSDFLVDEEPFRLSVL
jgi:hypothetical protein